MNIVALIPARGGSKGIPKKNIKHLAGQPLITYTIDAALKSDVNRVIVSTDDQEIAGIARKHDAEVPFIRPAHLAEDSTPDRPVVLHLIEWLQKEEHYDVDMIVYLRPTTPLKRPGMINEALELISNNSGFSALRSVTKSEAIFHPYWNFKVVGNTLKPFIDGIDLTKYSQRQKLPPCFRLNGMVDVMLPEIVKSHENLYGDNIGFMEINERFTVDIDTAHDFELAEFLISKMKTT